jgi:UDP-N-acetylmuramoyl-L-alanyl-D-glutamate--2,6-diaminopimelate ligase
MIMKLKQLIHGLEGIEVKGSKEIELTGISTDSRITSPGHLFLAKKGAAFDGREFIPQAIQSGASAVLSDAFNPFQSQVTQIIAPHPEELEAQLAARFYRHPSKELFVFGVTGTNGKTSTTYLVRHLIEQKEKGSCGLIGTIETILGDRRAFSTLTTHDVVTNQRFLREMADANSCAAALEVSSHGLEQGRLSGIEFDVGLFSNLTADHLDYHKTMEEYAKAKKRLFALLEKSSKKNKCAIANADDPYTPFLLEGSTVPRILFGFGEEADLRAESFAFSPLGTNFICRYQGQSQLFFTPLIGRFNIYNMLGAIAVGIQRGYQLEEMGSLFTSFEVPPGRLERIEGKRPIHVFIDYAHTNDALHNVLTTLREIAKKRIITVFGAGGNRDPGRRPGLARAAEKGSDVTIVTSDNPRDEDPQEICRQILAGFLYPQQSRIELDRKRAIELAIQIAKPDDIVLIAGKGHERVQIFGQNSVPFDDREVARAALKR